MLVVTKVPGDCPKPRNEHNKPLTGISTPLDEYFQIPNECPQPRDEFPLCIGSPHSAGIIDLGAQYACHTHLALAGRRFDITIINMHATTQGKGTSCLTWLGHSLLTSAALGVPVP